MKAVPGTASKGFCFSFTPLKTVFFHPKGSALFDTLVYRKGHGLNHHFLVLFLPITLTLAVVFDKESQCCASTASPGSEITHFHLFPNSEQFQQTPSFGAAIRGRGKATSLDFWALNLASLSILWNVKAGNPQQFTCSCPESVTCQLYTGDSLISVLCPSLEAGELHQLCYSWSHVKYKYN